MVQDHQHHRKVLAAKFGLLLLNFYFTYAVKKTITKLPATISLLFYTFK